MPAGPYDATWYPGKMRVRGRWAQVPRVAVLGAAGGGRARVGGRDELGAGS